MLHLQAARDVVLNRSQEHTQARQHTLRTTISVYDLLTIVLVRYGQFGMLSEVRECVKQARSYIALYPVLWTVQSTLHYFPGRPVHSDTISASLGSIQPYATINA